LDIARKRSNSYTQSKDFPIIQEEIKASTEHIQMKQLPKVEKKAHFAENIITHAEMDNILQNEKQIENEANVMYHITRNESTNKLQLARTESCSKSHANENGSIRV
jgi:ribosome-binding ATPase YchF (GTP1/OBG family)